MRHRAGSAGSDGFLASVLDRRLERQVTPTLVGTSYSIWLGFLVLFGLAGLAAVLSIADGAFQTLTGLALLVLGLGAAALGIRVAHELVITQFLSPPLLREIAEHAAAIALTVGSFVPAEGGEAERNPNRAPRPTRELAITAVMLIGTVGLGACATGGASVAPPYEPTFDYSAPEQTAPGSAEVTLALVSPRYGVDAPWTQSGPFPAMARGMRGDFNELLTARGFLVRGPFPSYDDMLFPDKSGSDLVLIPALNLTVDLAQVERARTEILSGKVQWKGTARIGGRVTLDMLESVSGARMWTKDIAVPAKTVAWEGSEWVVPDAPRAVVYADPGFLNSIGPALEGVYEGILTTAFDYLDPEEIRIVKQQAQEAREKAVVGGR